MTFCDHCGAAFERSSNRGPAPRFCSSPHRAAWHRAYRTRRAEIDAMFRREVSELFGVPAAEAARILTEIDQRIRERNAQ